MEMFKEILMGLIQVLIITIVPIISKFVIDLIRAKSGEIDEVTKSVYLQNIISTVTNLVADSVAYVSQTYVDALKKDCKFNKEEQKMAFDKAYARIISMIDEESKDVLTAVFVDFSLWIHTLIEATVRIQIPVVEPELPAPQVILIPEAVIKEISVPEVTAEEVVHPELPVLAAEDENSQG